MKFINGLQDGAAEGSHRCKVISFRVSDDEYGAVEAASKRHGSRSVALFARSIILTEKINDPTDTPVDHDINRLWRRVEALIGAVESVVHQINGIRDAIRSNRAASCSRANQ